MGSPGLESTPSYVLKNLQNNLDPIFKIKKGGAHRERKYSP